MRRTVAIAGLFMLALPAHGQPVPATGIEFAELLRGCWMRVNWPAELEAKPKRADLDFRLSHQMCLYGDSTMSFSQCEGLEEDCQRIEGGYEIRDGQLWRHYAGTMSGGRIDACDMTLEGGRWLTLANCEWVEAEPGVMPIEDISYELIVDP